MGANTIDCGVVGKFEGGDDDPLSRLFFVSVAKISLMWYWFGYN